MWDKKRAYRFIVLMGVVSLFADFTYEGAKGIIGPYLAFLGASALWVSLVSGLAELLGYWVRLLSGFFSDKLRSYWAFTLSGYALNLFAVPLLSLASSWQTASLLLFLERTGKGLRTPSRDALLSKATQVVGHGKGFGLHEFLDQIGAVLGPSVVALVLYLGFGYRLAFALLLVPAVFAMLFLLLAKGLEVKDLQKERRGSEASLGKVFYLYLIASCLVSLGFLQFPLMGFHLTQKLNFEGWQVALLFALAMGVDAMSALLFGVLYDRVGFISLIAGLSIGMFSTLFLLLTSQPLLAVVFWGISLGVQESIMRSAVAKLSSEDARGRAYGLFHFFMGLSAFLGGALMGLLYQYSLPFLIVYSVGLHLLAIGLLLAVVKYKAQ
ncbi:MAG: MFS transporter [Aquificaceae bacterium]